MGPHLKSKLFETRIIYQQKFGIKTRTFCNFEGLLPLLGMHKVKLKNLHDWFILFLLPGSDTNSQMQEPKFPTECFYLTVYNHHLSILPTVRKHQRCIRAIRELTRLVEELEGTEATWKHLPTAHRNRQIIKKYKSQCQVKFKTVSLNCIKKECLANWVNLANRV